MPSQCTWEKTDMYFMLYVTAFNLGKERQMHRTVYFMPYVITFKLGKERQVYGEIDQHLHPEVCT